MQIENMQAYSISFQLRFSTPVTQRTREYLDALSANTPGRILTRRHYPYISFNYQDENTFIVKLRSRTIQAKETFINVLNILATDVGLDDADRACLKSLLDSTAHLLPDNEEEEEAEEEQAEGAEGAEGSEEKDEWEEEEEEAEEEEEEEEEEDEKSEGRWGGAPIWGGPRTGTAGGGGGPSGYGGGGGGAGGAGGGGGCSV